MTINTSLLIAAPMLQDYFVDKDTGLPLSAGVVTCYQDNARTVLKNWYYQSGTAGAYTYIALPNPLVLSAVGTIVDINGNDTIPFFYPYSEQDSSTSQPYYITVVNSNGEQQFVRQNFPFIATQNSSLSVPTLKNYIVNNNFWRNVGSATLTSQTNYTVSPSAHDGFSMPDMQFFKNTAGATETVTFGRFPAGTPVINIAEGVQPEFYLNHSCTAAQSTETYKYYQIPIQLHLLNLQGTQATITIFGKNGAGNANNQIQLSLLQFTGTGGVAVTPINISPVINLTNNWKRHIRTFTFPTASGLTIGQAGDDSWYLQINIPTGVVTNISFTEPCLYLSSDIPTNDFTTYDETDAIINSPHTGDFRNSLNTRALGWVPANDGTIGSPLSSATTRANTDTWPLYNLLYSSVLNNWAPVSGGRTGVAYNDFINNKTITLTKNLGRVLAGLNPLFATPVTFTATVTTLSVSGVTVEITNGTPSVFTSASATLYTGQPIQFNSTGTLPFYLTPESISTGDIGLQVQFQINTNYYVNVLTATTFELALTQQDAVNGNTLSVCTTGTPPWGIINITDVLTFATAQAPILTAGTPVQLTNTGGALPAGLLANTVYYVSTNQLTGTTVTLSDNLDDALNGLFIGITTAGTGTSTLQTSLGAYVGSGYTTETPPHNHAIKTASSTGNGIYWSSGGASPNFTASTGSGVDFKYGAVVPTDSFGENIVEKPSIMQPTAFTNVYIKL